MRCDGHTGFFQQVGDCLQGRIQRRTTRAECYRQITRLEPGEFLPGGFQYQLLLLRSRRKELKRYGYVFFYHLDAVGKSANPLNPQIVPMSRKLALNSCEWAPGWTETNSHGYWLKEAQAQSHLDKPGPGYWCDMRILLNSDSGPVYTDHRHQR